MKNQIFTQENCHLLPTEDASPKTGMIGMNKYGHIIIIGDEFPVDKERFKPQHPYLTNNDEIKEGDWVYSEENKIIFVANQRTIDKVFRGLSSVKKIILTTDPKLIADGVLPIDGNTKAIVECYDILDDEETSYEVNFLTEFCKRYNQKDTKKVGVEKLADEYYNKIDERVSEHFRDRELILSNSRKGFIAGFEASQALQSTRQYSLEDMTSAYEAGEMKVELMKQNKMYQTFDEFIQSLPSAPKNTFSLEDIKKCFQSAREFNSTDGVVDIDVVLNFEQADNSDLSPVFVNADDYIQSLQPQPKGEIVIEVEMEENQCDGCRAGIPIEDGHLHRMGKRAYPDFMGCTKEKYNKIKLTNGQPTLIFK